MLPTVGATSVLQTQQTTSGMSLVRTDMLTYHQMTSTGRLGKLNLGDNVRFTDHGATSMTDDMTILLADVVVQTCWTLPCRFGTSLNALSASQKRG